jgi:hypothetical protein
LNNTIKGQLFLKKSMKDWKEEIHLAIETSSFIIVTAARQYS